MSYRLSLLRHRGHNSRSAEEVGEAEEDDINRLDHELDTMRPGLSVLRTRDLMVDHLLPSCPYTSLLYFCHLTGV